MSLLAVAPLFMADAAGAGASIGKYAATTLGLLSTVASVATVAILIYCGFLFMTSTGDADRLNHAKRVLRGALIGLLLVLLSSVAALGLHSAYTTQASNSVQPLPALVELQPQNATGDWTDLLIKAINGLFASIVEAIASPVLNALEKFTTSTPVMSAQVPVFNFWLVILAIANGLFAVGLSLLGFRVMSGEVLGLGEIEIRSVIPQVAFVFLLMFSSIFAIDALIGLNNAVIDAIHAGFPGLDMWHALVNAMARPLSLGLSSLILFVVFLILAVMLLIYYVGRIIILFIGAALSPLVVLLWLLPGFRDFATNLIKSYLVVVFVLIVHVAILMLAASLLTGLVSASSIGTPDPFMSIIIGIATIMALMRTQSLLIQMSLVSSGARATRKLGGQFVNGMKYTADKASAHAAAQLENARVAYLVNRMGAGL